MRVATTHGLEVELHDFGGDGPPLLVAHATGFCAGAYLPMVPVLARSFHVWAIDFRAHGLSDVPEPESLSWEGMTDDVLAVVDRIGEPVAAFGHSMGGACQLAAEQRRPGTITAAFLFEPIVIPPAWVFERNGNPLAEGARRRRPTFPSAEAALARYASRPPMGTCRADALAAYVEHAFRPTEDGEITLRCSPAHEAATFEAPGKPTIDEMPGVPIPVTIARGERDGEFGPAGFAGAIADAIPDGHLVRYRHLSHFGPFQDPDTLAEDAVAFLAN